MFAEASLLIFQKFKLLWSRCCVGPGMVLLLLYYFSDVVSRSPGENTLLYPLF